MTALSVFTDYLVVYLPGCPRPLIDRTVRDVAIEFCKKSDVWQETAPGSAYLVATISEYDAEVPVGAEIVNIKKAYHNGREIPCKTVEWLDANVTSWRTSTGDTPQYITSESPGTFLVVPVPAVNVAAGLTDMRISLKPTQTATTVPDILYDHHLQGIAAGVQARLKMIPNKEWTDPVGAGISMREYKNDITAAWLRVQKGFSEASLVVRPRAFGNGR